MPPELPEYHTLHCTSALLIYSKCKCKQQTTSKNKCDFSRKRFNSSHISTHMLHSWHQSQSPPSSPNTTHYIAHRFYSFIRNANVNSKFYRRINAISVEKDLILLTFQPLCFVVGINPSASRALRIPRTILRIDSTH